MLVDWLDGLITDSEDALDAGEPADAASDDANVSPPPPLPPALGSVSPVPEDPTADELAGLSEPDSGGAAC